MTFFPYNFIPALGCVKPGKPDLMRNEMNSAGGWHLAEWSECGQKSKDIYRILNVSGLHQPHKDQAQRGGKGNGEHLPECCSTLGQCVVGSPIGYIWEWISEQNHSWWLLFFRKIKSKTQHHLLYWLQRRHGRVADNEVIKRHKLG